MKFLTKNKLFLILAILFIAGGALRVLWRTWPAIKPVVNSVNIRELAKIPRAEKNITNSAVKANIPFKIIPGFSIGIYAENLGSPRVLLFDNKGILITSLTKQDKVVALLDNDQDGFAETSKELLVNLNRPHGLAMFHDWLYVAESDKILRYRYDEGQTKVLLPGEKILDLPNSGRHYTRTIGFGPDQRLYISIGSSCDICLETDERRASILSVKADGTDSKIYARGLRNSVFFDWHPLTSELYATEMGRDYLGDDLPPDEINIIKDGRGYGWPFCYGKQVYDEVFRGVNNCALSEPSFIDLPAHVSPLGIAFVPKEWGEDWENDILVAWHGSWNRTVPVGYELARFDWDEGNYKIDYESFIRGWLRDDGSAIGRPVGLVFDNEGLLYISDDKAGIIYRISKINDSDL